jgi:glycosyl transferase, family 25
MDFQTFNTFFDKIYIITIHRATERQEKIKRLMEGLNYEFYFGADKKGFSIDDLKARNIYDEAKAISNHRYGKAMNSGQIGCAWSHAMVYADIVKNNYRKALVLEDDVLVSESGVSAFEKIINELPADWELLFLDYYKNEKEPASGFIKKIIYHIQSSMGLLKWNHKMINHLFAKKLSPHISKAGFHDYTSAYAVTTGGAKKLLHLQTPISFVADNLLAYASTNQLVNAYLAIPKVFRQESQQSGSAAVSYVED